MMGVSLVCCSGLRTSGQSVKNWMCLGACVLCFPGGIFFGGCDIFWLC